MQTNSVNPLGVSAVSPGSSAGHPQHNATQTSASLASSGSGLIQRTPFSASHLNQEVAAHLELIAQSFLAAERDSGSGPSQQPMISPLSDSALERLHKARKKLTAIQANSFLENGETRLTTALKAKPPSPTEVRDLLLDGAWQHLKNKKGEAPLMLLNQIPPRRVMWNVQFYFLNINMPMANKAKSLKSFLEQYSASKTEERRAAFRAFVHGMG